MLCCRGRSLNFTNNLNINLLFYFIYFLYSYTTPPSHRPLFFLPTDHEISHQWSGNPYSWDSIKESHKRKPPKKATKESHQRKPQRLLVKLLTNIFNTKRSTVGIQLLFLVKSLNGIGVHTYIHSNLLFFVSLSNNSKY